MMERFYAVWDGKTKTLADGSEARTFSLFHDPAMASALAESLARTQPGETVYVMSSDRGCTFEPVVSWAPTEADVPF